MLNRCTTMRRIDRGATLDEENLFCLQSRSWTQPEVRLLWRYVMLVVSCTFLEALCRSVEDLEWLLLSVDVRISEFQRNILINGDWSPRLLESDGRSHVMPSDLCTALPLLGPMQPKCQLPKTNIDLGLRSPPIQLLPRGLAGQHLNKWLSLLQLDQLCTFYVYYYLQSKWAKMSWETLRRMRWN